MKHGGTASAKICHQDTNIEGTATVFNQFASLMSRSPNEQASNVSGPLRFDGASAKHGAREARRDSDQTLHSKLRTLQNMHVKETTQQTAARTMSWNEPDRLHGSTLWQTWLR